METDDFLLLITDYLQEWDKRLLIKYETFGIGWIKWNVS